MIEDKRMHDVRELLKQSGCSPKFIDEAMRFSKLYNGDIDTFIDKVEDMVKREEENDDLYDDIDEEDDPIYRSDYNYDGNEDNIYFEDEDGEEAFEDDEEEE